MAAEACVSPFGVPFRVSADVSIIYSFPCRDGPTPISPCHTYENAASKQSPTSPATAIERMASGGHRAGQRRERARPAEQASATATRTSTVPIGERAQQSDSTSDERIRRLRRANAATPASGLHASARSKQRRGQARWWPASARAAK